MFSRHQDLNELFQQNWEHQNLGDFQIPNSNLVTEFQLTQTAYCNCTLNNLSLICSGYFLDLNLLQSWSYFSSLQRKAWVERNKTWMITYQKVVVWEKIILKSNDKMLVPKLSSTYCLQITYFSWQEWS